MTIHRDTGRRLGRMIGQMDDMILTLGSMVEQTEDSALSARLEELLNNAEHMKADMERAVSWVNEQLRGGG